MSSFRTIDSAVDERRPRVFWALAGPRDMASSRLHGYSIHEQLRDRGWDSHLLYEPLHLLRDLPIQSNIFRDRSPFRTGDVLVVQKLSGPSTVSALKGLGAIGVHTIFVDCDHPPKLNEARAAGAVICTSQRLGAMYSDNGIGRVFIIPEAYEKVAACAHVHQSGRRLTLVWFGSIDQDKAGQIRALRSLLEARFPHYRLITISNDQDADFRWALDSSFELIAKCDVVVITGSNTDTSSCKSSNRLIQAMALGLPVIAFPILSYRGLIRHGRNGLLCEGEEEWTAALLQIGSSKTRHRLASVGFRYARRYYSSQNNILLWEQAIRAITGSDSNKEAAPHEESPLDEIDRIRAEASLGMARELHRPMQRLSEWSRVYEKEARMHSDSGELSQ